MCQRGLRSDDSNGPLREKIRGGYPFRLWYFFFVPAATRVRADLSQQKTSTPG